MKRTSIHYNANIEPDIIDIGMPMGEPIIGEGLGEIIFEPIINISNELWTYKGTTINVGDRTTDEIISDLIDKYSDVWHSLA